MAKVKLTKGELKKQRDSLKQFRHYLPTLLLKKQQLQMKILEARKLLKERLDAQFKVENAITPWAGLLSEQKDNLKEWITPEKVLTENVNIAGANVPFFKDVLFKRAEYDLFITPFWVDQGIEQLRELVKAIVEVELVKRQIAILEKELRTTTQRVNLFEKVKIPECLDSIRVITIYLGDQQANAVGVSKVAKKKIEQKNLAEAAA